MRSLATILLPVDFSERSAGAARYARLLATHFQSELVLFHVLTPPQFEFGALDISGAMIGELYRTRAEQATRELDSFLAGELEGLNVRRILREGDPASEIVRFALDRPADLIIMPTHGYGPFRRYILGSNTAKVLHDADCPVWTGVHLQDAPAATPIPLRHVLCALDLGPLSSRALAWADGLRRSFGARFTVLHVTPPCPDPGPDQRGAARQELLRLQPGLDAEAEVLLEAGEPASVIWSVAARVGADVLVIGRGSAAGVFGRLRTNAYAIIRQSPCPVVSV